MQKFKAIASKSQKKHTIVLSADSELLAKEKLHKEGYSILSISELQEWDISGKKFIFQVKNEESIKNGAIIWKDIFKVYKKLVDDLWYEVIFLYPEWDDAQENAEKKQEIMEGLKKWYTLQKKDVKQKNWKQKWEDNFYMQKELDATYILIDLVVKKIDLLFNNKKLYDIDDETFRKIQEIYEKLIHIKSSTNIIKLKEIWELALTKIAQIELDSVEKNKSKASRKLLGETNSLLKKIGSSKQFIERDKDYKRIAKEAIKEMLRFFSPNKIKRIYSTKKSQKKEVDTESYNFLKTILLLDKYEQKLKDNSREIRKNFLLFLNIFQNSEAKEKILLKRKVIKQNISILQAKKTGTFSSYTWVKKWYYKVIERGILLTHFISNILFLFLIFYIGIFLIFLVVSYMGMGSLRYNMDGLFLFLLFFVIYLVFTLSKNLFVFSVNIVFFIFLFIFSVVNF